MDTIVKQTESEIDQFFENSLPIQGIWRSTVIEALLDRAELLITGHPEAGSQHAEAVRSLYLNVCAALSTSLRAAHRVCETERTAVPNSLDTVATDCIALTMMYNSLEDAFYGYWKGYARASFPKEHVIQFVPTGGELDARLRRFESSDELEPANADFHDPLEPEAPLTREFVDSLVRNSQVKQQGGFTYAIDTNIVNSVVDAHFDFLYELMGNIPEINLGRFSLVDLLRGWSVMRAVSQIHKLISILLSQKPGDFGTSVNWPAIYRERGEWLRWFSSVRNSEDVMQALTFDPSDTNADVAVTPIVHIGDDWFGTIPSLVMRSNVSRNVFVLLANRFGDAYSTYTQSKEDILLQSFAAKFPERVIAMQVRLPEHHGRQLPDIDLLLRGERAESVVVVEAKWQLSASTTKEVVSRNEYLKKGQEQLRRIRTFLGENPDYLKQRAFVNFSITHEKIQYLLLTKGHLGGEDTIVSDTLMVDYDIFVDYLRRFGLGDALGRLASYDYLPVLNKDFLLADIKLRFGDWIVLWKKFHPTTLPPDQETPALEELYRRAAKYLGHT